MHVLVEFVETLNQEKDKLVYMGTIKSTKYQYLASSVSDIAKGDKKFKYLNQQRAKEKKHSNKERSS